MNRREYIKHTTALLGYAVSSAAVLQLISSCQHQTSIGWSPVFFNEEQASLISEIAETILPETKTPGAKSIGVPQFIDQLYAQLLTDTDKKNLIEGMNTFQTECIQKFKKPFTQLTKEKKEEFLIAQDEQSPRFPISMWGIMLDPHPPVITFYRRIKSMVLMVYFTSEKIGKEVLVYDPVPGDYHGCIPLGDKNAYTD
ncbi:MAG: gluconate 2-dehydrogenase subunit 3 family protein [Saprospiraceae bacterium]